MFFNHSAFCFSELCYNYIISKTSCLQNIAITEEKITLKSTNEHIFNDKKASSLVDHAIFCLGLPTVYLWGGLGEIITEDIIRDRKEAYPKQYTEEYCESLRKLIGKNIHGFDCSGLIKNFIMGGIADFKYNASLDMNSYMMLSLAEQSGPIETIPEIPGVCLFMPGHAGIYIGNGYVIESTSNVKFGNGVVKTMLSDRKWTNWFFCKGVNYTQQK